MNLAEKVFKTLHGGELVKSPSMKWKALTLKEYKSIYEASVRDLESFWRKEALKLSWKTPWSKTVEGAPPRVSWFKGGRINAYYNIVGKHRDSWVWSKPAVIWEGEDWQVKVATYKDLDELVEKLAGALKVLGVRGGDWILLYAPPTLEVIALMLASIRLGAPFEPVFTGFGYRVLAERIAARKPKILVVADGFYRRGRVVDTLSTARRALEHYKCNCSVIVVERVGSRSLYEGELSFDSLLEHYEPLRGDFTASSEHPLFGLHSAYEEGFKPITHATGGYLVQVYATSRWIGLRPHDTYFCTVWPGWITGVSYVVFGPLMVGSTLMVYEGGPDWPRWDRWWDIIEAHAITLFLTTGGALRVLAKQDPLLPRLHNMDTLRAILVTAEPLEYNVWRWAYTVIGTGHTPTVDSIPEKLTGRIPIVNLYIQSEIGTFITGNLLNYTFPPLMPSSTGPPIPGFHVDVVDENGNPVRNTVGELVVSSPWPAMPIEFPEEFEIAWSKGYYKTGDYAVMHPDSYIFALGRRDAVMKVNGYRLSPGAIEELLEETFKVKTLVAGAPDELRFEAPIIIVENNVNEAEARKIVRDQIGPIADPKLVIQTIKIPEIPKKQLRRTLKNILWFESPGTPAEIMEKLASLNSS